MPKRPLAPTSLLACRRCFEPARVQQQLRSEAYAHLVPGPRPARMADRRRPQDQEPAPATFANPCGGICA
jgi:hypothetical protein